MVLTPPSATTAQQPELSAVVIDVEPWPSGAIAHLIIMQRLLATPHNTTPHHLCILHSSSFGSATLAVERPQVSLADGTRGVRFNEISLCFAKPLVHPVDACHTPRHVEQYSRKLVGAIFPL